LITLSGVFGILSRFAWKFVKPFCTSRFINTAWKTVQPFCTSRFLSTWKYEGLLITGVALLMLPYLRRTVNRNPLIQYYKYNTEFVTANDRRTDSCGFHEMKHSQINIDHYKILRPHICKLKINQDEKDTFSGTYRKMILKLEGSKCDERYAPCGCPWEQDIELYPEIVSQVFPTTSGLRNFETVARKVEQSVRSISTVNFDRQRELYNYTLEHSSLFMKSSFLRKLVMTDDISSLEIRRKLEDFWEAPQSAGKDSGATMAL
jgi:hypothetical protein